MNTANHNHLILSAVATVLFSTLASAAPPTQSERTQVALEKAAARAAVSPESLSVTTSSKVALPTLGRTVYSYKLLDRTRGTFINQTIDEKGAEVDLKGLMAKERAMRDSWYGRLDDGLVDRLSFARATDQIAVDIWLKAASVDDSELSAIDAASARNAAAADEDSQKVAALRSRQALSVKMAVNPVVNRLQALGYSVAWDGVAPRLHVTVSAEDLQKLAHWPEVLQVSAKAEVKSMGDLIPIVLPTVGADVMHQRGLNGAGRIAQVEVGGMVYQNPYLPRVYVDTNASLCANPKGPDHAAAVAGILHYMAPGADILSTGDCYGTGNTLQQSNLRAINWGARVINNSWGETIPAGRITPNDTYYDWLVINYRRLQVVAAGNTSGKVSAPAAAYNVLSVGNYDDKNTVAWAGDSMHPTSAYIDPVSAHQDRQKPEVAAPGTNFSSATNGSPAWNWVGYGTSYASPVVAGMAAMMMQRAPSLVNWPVATKAILMATAVHNIEGASRLSTKDGAGGVWGPYAEDVTRGANGSWAAANWTCATPSKAVANIQLFAGKLTRVVIAWNTDTNYTYYQSQPSADYDLTVTGPTGSVVAQSGSYDNTYEIVEFKPTVTGTYRINVLKDRCDVSPRTLAYAWFRTP